MKVEENKNPDNYNSPTTKTKTIKITQASIDEGYIFNISTLGQISFDGTCTSSNSKIKVTTDNAEKYDFEGDSKKGSVSKKIEKKTDCDEIKLYRDKVLYTEFSKAYDKYSIYNGIKSDLQKHRDEILSGSTWDASDARLIIGVVAKNIKATCDLISGLLDFVPSKGVTNLIAKQTYLTAQNVYDAIKAGKQIDALVKQGTQETAYKIILKELGPVGKSVKIAWELSQNISGMVSLPKDQKANRGNGTFLRLVYVHRFDRFLMQ